MITTKNFTISPFTETELSAKLIIHLFTSRLNLREGDKWQHYLIRDSLNLGLKYITTYCVSTKHVETTGIHKNPPSHSEAAEIYSELNKFIPIESVDISSLNFNKYEATIPELTQRNKELQENLDTFSWIQTSCHLLFYSGFLKIRNMSPRFNVLIDLEKGHIRSDDADKSFFVENDISERDFLKLIEGIKPLMESNFNLFNNICFEYDKTQGFK